MSIKIYRPLIWVATFIAMVSLACSLVGGTQQATPLPIEPTEAVNTPTEEQQDLSEPTKEQSTEPQENNSQTSGGAISNRADVEKAVVRIEAKGDFVYPEGDYGVIYDTVGSGTGFIIDPSGIAVTNNHVVTGADSLKVYFSGDDKGYTAKVIGYSECSDLAVIDIEGDGYPYLSWYGGTIDVGMDVWSAGYPLGDPNYSLHKGIVSKREASLGTDWAAVESIIEHDATINPGNSGGPLINENGEVIAVNYASTSAAVGQFYAISRDEAEDVVSTLEQGKNENSIGVNGFSFVSEDGSLSGIWVYSVDTNSSAYKAGVRGGDILTELEGSLLGTDGTKTGYCEILRSHNSSDAMSIQVLRLSTGEILEGTLNDEKLAVVGYWSSGTTTDTDGTTTSTGYTEVVDDFEQDNGNFEVFTGAQQYGGYFYLGKFSDCADVGSGNSFGCFSTCLTCGDNSEYQMQVEAAYADGVTERTFGMVLRFVDYNGNGLVDSGDYYLDFELSIYDKYLIIWEHRTDGSWYTLYNDYNDSINPARNWNTLYATAYNGGESIDFYINGDYVTTIYDIPYTSGTVGLVMGGRAMQVAFDNFIYTTDLSQ